MADDHAHRIWPWHKRVASAVTRRASAWRRRFDDGPRPVERAVAWLNRQNRLTGLAARPGSPPCPRLTAAVLPILLEFGQSELLDCWLNWLLSVQKPDGSFPARTRDESCTNTATAVCALSELTLAGMGKCKTSAARAGAFLGSVLPQLLEFEGGAEGCNRAATALCGAAALRTVGREFSRDDWQHAAELVLARLQCAVDWHLWNDGSRMSLLAAEAWLASGEIDMTRDMVRRWSARQRRDGALPAAGDGGGHEVLAHVTVLWYRLGERDRANRAIAFLHRQMRCDGGSPWTIEHYLDAARLQVAASFDQPSTLPTTIASDDGRLLAVHDWLPSLGLAARVADVGCGPGRFVRELSNQFAEATFVGIDPSPAMLAELPPGIERRQGSLLRIPAGDGEFDGVFAVESLEHSLLPERAVDELCRVVRPGGKILVIDKHRGRQPLSLHQPWEQWFLPETVERWLARHCSDVRVEPVAHGAAGNSKLFLCWQGTRYGL